MKKTVFALFSVVAVCAFADYPRIVENSVVWSRRGNAAVITYSLEGTSGIVTAKITRNGAEVPQAELARFAGDVNCVVEPGDREFTWCPKFSETVTDLKVELTVVPESLPPDYMVVDLASGDVRYYAASNDIPEGIGGDLYRKTKMLFRKIPAANRIWRKGDNARITKLDDKFHNRNRPGLVTLTYDYWAAVYPLTHAQYRAVTGNWAPSRMTNVTGSDGVTRNRQTWPTEDEWLMCPADGISIAQMRGDPENADYAWPAMGRKGVDTGSFLGILRARTGGALPFDMPTAAEWEYACRGESITTLGMTRFDGDGPSLADIEKYAWCKSNSQTDDFVDQYGAGRTQKVGQKLPNLWGLYDMLGNLYEICLDYNPADENLDTADLPHQVDPVGLTDKTKAKFDEKNGYLRQTRGGAYADGGSSYRPSFVHNTNVGEKYANGQWYGHRVFCPIASAEHAAVQADVPTLTFDAATREATIAYRITGTADKIVTIDIKTNGVSIGAQNFALLGGDVNKRVSPDYHRIYWRPDHTWAGHHVDTSVDNLTVEVKEWSVDNPPDYAVLHLGCASTPMYYDSVEAIPFGIQDERYKLDNIVFRKIPAAGRTWRMGGNRFFINANEKPHLVQLTKDYWCSVFELTQRQYYTLTGTDDLNNLDESQKGDKRFFYPSHQSFNTMRSSTPWPAKTHALSGVNWLTRLRTLYPDFQVDLPTEAQWEFAARAGTASTFLNGSDDTSATTGKALIDPYAWHNENNADDPDYVEGYPHAVGLKLPNRWGLYDMGGNEQEICLDWATGNLQPSDGSVIVDPVGPASGDYIVSRSNAFSDGWQNFRTQYRKLSQVKPSTGDRLRGLRIVAPVEPEDLD